MRRRDFLSAVGVGAAAVSTGALAAPAKRPNIIYIMADDMGYGDLGSYGQKMIKTPMLDKMAAEGTRYTDVYTGSCICAPTRCTLMTGLHSGHCTRRNNKSRVAKPALVPLNATDVTVASVLKKAGYTTGGIGKWGLGNPGTTGTPDQHGFDLFYGYLDQVHAHNYYTDYLMRNTKREELPGNKGKGRKTYAHDLFEVETLKFIREHKDEPFFLYLPYTIPHGKHEVPSDAPYSDEKWSKTSKNYAAMITRMDAGIGQMFDLLKELNLDNNTIVFFTSDNGATSTTKPFNGGAGLKGLKGSLYEGGIRTPMLARWPGKVPAGAVSDFAWWHLDFFPTACDLAGAQAPKNLDGMSVVPTLLGKKQEPHEALYWEFNPSQQAVRMGKWKGYRRGTKSALELYDLSKDIKEANNIAAQHPEVVSTIEAVMAREHVDSVNYPLTEGKPEPKKKRTTKSKAKKA